MATNKKKQNLSFKNIFKDSNNLAVFGITLFLIAFFSWMWYGIYIPKEDIFKSYEFTIVKGDGFRQVASKLEGQGIIRSRIFFEVYGVLTGKYKSIQPGKYELSTSFSVSEIFWKIARGEFLKKRILIMEGFTLKDIEEALKDRKMDSAEGFATSVLSMNFSNKFEFLKDKPKEQGLEGYIFPDTYNVRVDSTKEEFVLQTLANFDRKFTQELRGEIKKQGKTYYEIITMASLLEKEAYIYKDKQIIAGLLWKRIENNWPLQVDASLTYVTDRYSMQLTLKDLAMDSPYNTYKYKGLPLGPICNPGIDSIKAAIYPQKSSYWYYLSTKGGRIIFAKTLSEHSANKLKR